jgi:hypothetical protein
MRYEVREPHGDDGVGVRFGGVRRHPVEPLLARLAHQHLYSWISPPTTFLSVAAPCRFHHLITCCCLITRERGPSIRTAGIDDVLRHFNGPLDIYP